MGKSIPAVRNDGRKEVSCGIRITTAKYCREKVDVQELRRRKDEFTLPEMALMFNVELLFKPLLQSHQVEPFLSHDRITLNITDTEAEHKETFCNVIESLLVSRNFHAI